MAVRDLRNLYGEGNAVQVINRAVRKEIPGGKQLFDLMEEIFPLKNDEKYRSLYEKLEEIKQVMRDSIAKKYQLVSQNGEKND